VFYVIPFGGYKAGKVFNAPCVHVFVWETFHMKADMMREMSLKTLDFELRITKKIP
jgi:hypothetical protein